MPGATTKSGRWRNRLACGWQNAASRRAAALTLLAGVLLGGLLIGLGGRNPDSATETVLVLACWLLIVGGIAGTLLAGYGSCWGWLILLGLQPVWVGYAVATHQYGFVLSAVAYGIGHLKGFWHSQGPRTGAEEPA